MAIQTTLATRFWFKTIMMVIVCFVLGVWGVYDLVITIPWENEAASRHEFLTLQLQPAMDPPYDPQKRINVSELLQTRISNGDGKDEHWLASMKLFKDALDGGDEHVQRAANETLASDSTLYDVIKPSKFDWYMQWVFAICIPFAFYYLFVYIKMRNKANIYRYEDDGTLTTPEGTWAPEDIIGIDMSRWIAKTGNARSTWTAKVDVGEDKKIVLDDYLFKDMHLIIGAIGHRFYPNEWTPIAKSVKNESKESLCNDDTGSQEED